MPVPQAPVHAPEFPPTLEWIGSERMTMAELRGNNAVLVDFFDYTCVNCLRTLPYLQEWNRRYAGKGLAVIGVHSPEFSFAADGENVEPAVRRLGIEYPVAVDSNYEVWRLYGNRFWPAKYLWNREGLLTWHHFGEGEYQATEDAIQKALIEIDQDLRLPAPMSPLRDTDAPGARCLRPTPELYLGSERGRTPAPIDRIGRWQIADEYSEAAEAGDELAIKYEGASANVVLAPPDNADAKVEVLLDGRLIQTLDVSDPRMYPLVEETKHERHKLQLRFLTAGTRAYAFTFSPGCI